MQQFLFVVEISYPSDQSVGTNVSREWTIFEIRAQKELPPALAKSKITRNVWLFDSENGLPSLIELSNLAKTCGLAYTAFLLHDGLVKLATQVTLKS